MSAIEKDAETWHRNPWVWLVIAIPSLTVLGCMLTIYLAITNPLTLVNDSAKPGDSTTDVISPEQK